MSEFRKDCDPVDALDFRPDESQPIGYLLDLSVAGAAVPPELKVAVPTDVTAQQSPGAGIRLTPAVAVLGSVYWSTRPGDPIRLFAYAEAGVARRLAALRDQATQDQIIRVALVVYDCDHRSGTYFTEFQTLTGSAPAGTPPGPETDPAAPAAPVFGRLGRDGLLVAEDHEDLTPDVRVHAVQFELVPMPAPRAQQIMLQPQPGAKVVKEFGLPSRSRP
ncbi:hypothetical protein AB0F81_46785 [Actinoplanes sp. NPDC024001]|uniref:hypothetical protein n=1 Tax=Actinoplanes sp. NPDC024001 TaxID=3154598 RepID=UPI0033D76464